MNASSSSYLLRHNDYDSQVLVNVFFLVAGLVSSSNTAVSLGGTTIPGPPSSGDLSVIAGDTLKLHFAPPASDGESLVHIAFAALGDNSNELCSLNLKHVCKHENIIVFVLFAYAISCIFCSIMDSIRLHSLKHVLVAGGTIVTSYRVEWDTAPPVPEVQSISTLLDLGPNEIQTLQTRAAHSDEVQVVRTRAVAKPEIQTFVSGAAPLETLQGFFRIGFDTRS